MTEQSSAAQSRAPARGGALATVVGSLALATAMLSFTGSHEGEKHVAYQDIGGVWTICDGETVGVRRGDIATHPQCMVKLDRTLASHASAVLRCTPGLKGHGYQLAAASDLAYNIGDGAYCRSTAARQFNANRWRAACDSFLAWRFAAGREVQGLLNRRRAERALCLTGLAA